MAVLDRAHPILLMCSGMVKWHTLIGCGTTQPRCLGLVGHTRKGNCCISTAFPQHTVVNQTDYLKIDLFAEATPSSASTPPPLMQPSMAPTATKEP